MQLAMFSCRCTNRDWLPLNNYTSDGIPFTDFLILVPQISKPNETLFPSVINDPIINELVAGVEIQ